MLLLPRIRTYPWLPKILLGPIAVWVGGLFPAAADTVAYWRFEERPAGSDVISEDNSVVDWSGEGNHLRSAWFFSTPAYIANTPFDRVPWSGETNELALSFSGSRYLYTTEDKSINSLPFDQWTLEASVKLYAGDGEMTIVAKHSDSTGTGPPTIRLSRPAGSSRIEINLLDGLGVPRSVSSLDPLEANAWYRVAATGTASQLSLWLKRPGDTEYQLQGRGPITGAFFNGYRGLGHTAPWALGRGMGNLSDDYFQGVVDEVRISRAALDPSEFLAYASITTNPAVLEAKAVHVVRTEEGEEKDFLAMEIWPPEPMEELRIEGSPDLLNWEEIPIVTESFRVRSAGRDRLRLTSAISLNERLSYFLRAKVQPSPPMKSEPANPVFAGADPGILLVNDTLWVYPTFGNRRFYAFSSKDLVHWKMHGPLLYFWEVDWIPSDKHAWAPGIATKDGLYYLYYSAGPKPSHIGVAVSDSPGGPFIDSGGPLLSDGGSAGFEAIDAMVFTDPRTGTYYFYAGGSAGAKLRVFELADDMTSFAREIAVDTPTKFTEGAFMHFRNRTYYLSYSHGYWKDQTYSVHYSTSTGPTGPWTCRGAILVSDEKHKGPGHHSIFHSPHDDQGYIVYHRWNDRSGPGPYSGSSRQIAIERLDYDAERLIKPIGMIDTGVGPVSLGPPSE